MPDSKTAVDSRRREELAQVIHEGGWDWRANGRDEWRWSKALPREKKAAYAKADAVLRHLDTRSEPTEGAARLPEAGVDVDLSTRVADAVWADESTAAELDLTRRILEAYAETVEPADCDCGWGGVHDRDNPRCTANQDKFHRGDASRG